MDFNGWKMYVKTLDSEYNTLLAKENELISNNKEYKNLVDAHIAISIMISQQAEIGIEIHNKRLELLKAVANWDNYESITKLDKDNKRKIISEWALQSLIKL